MRIGMRFSSNLLKQHSTSCQPKDQTSKIISWVLCLKDDFQSVLRSFRTLMFINILNGSLDGMRINFIR